MESLYVLIVDDEEDFVETMVKRLKKRNIEVFGVLSGEEAIAFLHKENPPVDLVVLDIKMPGKSWKETLQEIKQYNPLIEIILLSGHASLETARQGLDLGAFDYLIKPIALDDLLYKFQDAYKCKKIKQAQCDAKAISSP